MRAVLSLVCFLLVFMMGCANSRMTTTKTLTDGSKIEYEVVVNSWGQDFSGSDLSATLDPDGKNTIKAGAVDNTTSQVSADVAASMVDLFKAILPYLATPTVAP